MPEPICDENCHQPQVENSRASPLDSVMSSQNPTLCQNGLKEKRQPSITPRKFKRFFSPRSHGSFSTSSRRALEDITGPANNRRSARSSPLRPALEIGAAHERSPTTFTREMKRRKLLHTPSPSPDDLSSVKNIIPNTNIALHFEDLDQHSQYCSSPCPASIDQCAKASTHKTTVPACTPKTRIRRSGSRGIDGRLVELNIGSSGRLKRQNLRYPITDWQDQTAAFYSLPDDMHLCRSIGSSAGSIPFCVASCKTNSLVAVGDEEGQIRLLESANDGKPQFKDIFMAFRPHSNAIIDMSFSLDDSLLATASGDQTAKVVDMTTQSTISVLARHSASLKQVKFQPGAASNSVLATSSRDGTVQIWDLRCKGGDGPVQEFYAPVETITSTSVQSRLNRPSYGCVVNSIHDAHRSGIHGRLAQLAAMKDGPSTWDAPGRFGVVSVTAIDFLPEGNEHILLTGSEANASVKLWDIRALHNTRRKATLPVSYTSLPESHNQWRHFGVNSINLSGDGSRLYTLCRDNTIYAYSTAHLILGHAPELSDTWTWGRRQEADVQGGLGPLYGFRHQQLHATSFYVKSAVRPAKAGNVEMLAVGSADGCSVLFPTDERYLRLGSGYFPSQIAVNPHPRHMGGNLTPSQLIGDTIPMSENGTALVRGHEREVSALTWTSGGELVTVGDDFLVRCWREGGTARRLRMGGEEGGQRWGCGWASVSASYDDDDD